MKLSQEQIQEFDSNGVILAQGVLNAADLQPVIDELEEWIDARANQLKLEGKIDKLYEGLSFDQRYGYLFGQSNEISHGMDIMQQRGQAMFEFLHNSNLLDAVEGLTGPEITCNPIQHVRAKPPSEFEPHTGPSFHVVPWHQDAGVMMPESEESTVITCWMPLGDATEEMGCLKVIPGVHKEGYRRHIKALGTAIDPELMPEPEPVTLACRKGDVIFMSKYTPHRSTPNNSNKCRWSLDLRYQTTGHHTGRTAHPDFVVRSEQNPNSVMNRYDEWCRLWVDAFENPRGFVGHRSE
ncbi:MAG: phytanoyl-CoA dioxygenase family protein [Chloroflexota bacterium]